MKKQQLYTRLGPDVVERIVRRFNDGDMAVEDATVSLGISRAQLYNLRTRWLAAGKSASFLGRSGGDRAGDWPKECVDYLTTLILASREDGPRLTLDSLSGESGTTLVGQQAPRTFSFLTAADFLGTFKLAYPHTISFRADAGATAYAPRVNAAGKTVVDVPNADGTLELTSLYGNARAEKSGPGTLRIVNGGGQQTLLTVKEASTVELVGAPSDMTATADDLPAPFLWFDADVEASLTTADGTVTKWIDVRSVTDNVSRRYLAKWDEIDCPLLVSNAANGHAVLDFGKRHGDVRQCRRDRHLWRQSGKRGLWTLSNRLCGHDSGFA